MKRRNFRSVFHSLVTRIKDTVTAPTFTAASARTAALATAALITALFAVVPTAFAETWEEALPKIAQSKARLLFFGDSHSSEFHRQALQELQSALHANDANRNCVLSELDPTWYQAGIDGYLKSDLEYSELPATLYSSTPEFIQKDYGLSYFVKNVSGRLPRKLLDTVRENQAKLIAIDLPKTESYITKMGKFPNILLGEMPTSEQWDERNRMQMIERNAHMTKRIEALLDSGECRRAIVFVGADHLTQYGNLLIGGEEVKPIPEMISKNISVESIYLFFDGEEIEKYNKRLAPSLASGHLKRIDSKSITYTPTISRW